MHVKQRSLPHLLSIIGTWQLSDNEYSVLLIVRLEPTQHETAEINRWNARLGRFRVRRVRDSSAVLFNCFSHAHRLRGTRGIEELAKCLTLLHRDTVWFARDAKPMGVR